MPDDLMTVRDAAAEFQITERAIRSGLVSGSIQPHYRKGRVMVRRTQMRVWRDAVDQQKYPGRAGRQKSGESA